LMPGTASVYTAAEHETRTASDALNLRSHAQDNGYGSLPL
jgi:hypothetical protein